MKFSVILFKDSNCDLCKLMQQEIIDNPPAADIKIVHVGQEEGSYEASLYNVTHFPTTLLINENNTVISRFEGFINTKSIDINIKQYETECMV